MSSTRRAFVYLFVLLACVAAGAREHAVVPQEKQRMILDIPRIDKAPTLDDFKGMKARTKLAKAMLKVCGFVQHEPSDGAEPSQKTDAYLGYDDKNLYVAFMAFDSDPSGVRARLSRREDVWADDTVEIMLDTFDDQRRGYTFVSNPIGVQWDGTWTEGRGFDSSFDTVWDSYGKVTNKGYMVLMAIPFRSLRFSPAELQTWGVILNRSIIRNNESDFLPAISAEIPGRLNQSAAMAGLERVSPGRNVQLMPYVSGRSSRSIDSRDGYKWNREAFAADIGFDSKLVLRDSLVLDTTLNPDFSQVESDDPQVTANQRFELWFPEKRPFFLENASFFQTPINLVFTRRIGDPKFGTRLTGKAGKFAVGALFADDEGPGRSVADYDPLSGKKAYFAIGRVSRDILKESSVGVLFTNREFAGSYNRVGGVDTRLKLGTKWVASAQAVTSSTLETDGTRSAGPAYEANISRDGRQFYTDAEYSYVSPGFVSKPGFVNRTDIARFNQYASYRFRPEGETLISWGPSASFNRTWDSTGQRLEEGFGTEMRWSFRGQSNIALVYNYTDENLRPSDFDTLTDVTGYRRYSTGFNANLGKFEKFSVSTSARWERRTNFVPESGPPVEAGGNSANLSVTMRPVSTLRVDNSYNYSRMTDLASGESAFNSHIVRSKWNWQFTRALSLRVIGTYQSVLANPLHSGLDSTKRVNGDVLLTYLVHPGTALHVGYNSNLQNLDPALRSDADGNLLRTRDQFVNDGRQLFFKLSYLLRF